MNVKLKLSALALFCAMVIAVITACGSGDNNTSTTATTGKAPQLITIAPSGKFAYVANWGSNNISGYGIDATTGALTALPTVDAATNPTSIAIDPSGKFAYVTNYGSNSISVYRIDTASGALTAGTAVAAGANPASVAVDRIRKICLCGKLG